jgi:hypothetical protein
MASSIIKAIVLAASCFFTLHVLAATGDDARLVRVFNDPLRTIAIENLNGATEVRIWPEPGVSVTASRPGSPDNSRIEAEVVFERPARDQLRIAANPDSLFRPITLTVLVPGTIQVSVRGGTQRVSVKGQPASLSVETQTGNVIVYLPEKSNTDLSLRSIRGDVESRLPVAIFGQTNAHILDGRIGVGGSPVIARSQRGNITVRPEAGADTASTSETSGIASKQDLVAGDAGTSDLKPAPTTRGTNSAGGDPGGEDVIKLEARLVNLNVKVTDVAGKTLPALKRRLPGVRRRCSSRRRLFRAGQLR